MSSCMHPLIILISGGGSNMKALVQASQKENWEQRFNAPIAGVISNRADASGLQWAQAQGLRTALIEHRFFAHRHDFENALANTIDQWAQPFKPWVLLAGFMRILDASFVERYAPHMLNIHPSLLPAFQGLHTHQRALEAGCQFAGATVHRVTPVLDEGEIIEQAAVPILKDDSAETLAARVLSQEHIIYPRALRRLLQAQALSQSPPLKL